MNALLEVSLLILEIISLIAGHHRLLSVLPRLSLPWLCPLFLPATGAPKLREYQGRQDIEAASMPEAMAHQEGQDTQTVGIPIF